MKAKLIFNTSDPDEFNEFQAAVKARSIVSAVWDFLANSHRKYDNEQTPSEFFEGYTMAQQELRNSLLEDGIDIDTLLT